MPTNRTFTKEFKNHNFHTKEEGTSPQTKGIYNLYKFKFSLKGA